MSAFFQKKWVKLILLHLLLIGGTGFVLLVMSLLLDGSCPVKLLFHVPCPFCGMTRAHLAALRLDFAAAFSYHPLFFLGIPFLFVIFHEGLFKGRAKKIHFLLECGLTLLFLIVYICRLF